MLFALGTLYLLASLFDLVFCFWGPYPLVGIGLGDIPYFTVLGLHFLWGVLVFLIMKRGSRWKWHARMPELLGSITLLFFLFSYIYALNANMDYIQRFAETSGNLRLAPDTKEERIISVIRYVPLLMASIVSYLTLRIGFRRELDRTIRSPRMITRWSYPLILLSACLTALAFPSFASLRGFALLAFVSLIPLFAVLRSTSYGWAVFYGTVFGVFSNTLINYWLGTFALVSLQITIVGFAFFFLLFMLPAVWLYQNFRSGRFLVLPFAWVVFEYLRSLGFLGYPWGLMGASQYEVLPLIQVTSLTGIWGLSFVVVLVNSGMAEVLYDAAIQRSVGVLPQAVGLIPASVGAAPGAGEGGRPARSRAKRLMVPLYVSMAVLLLTFVGGSLSLYFHERRSASAPERQVRVALVQQNSDPRKHEYRQTWDTLKDMSTQASGYDPDLILWSETAFVPNIRRWSQEDPQKHYYAKLVFEFLDYVKELKTWLVTGNDDYELTTTDAGEQLRFEYNATVMFAPDGERRETYRKLHLVPFTEYFPYEEQFPRFTEMLRDFDVYLWEPGDTRVVFDHPKFSFATPICYEDTFPMDIRKFVRDGAEALLTVSNDYWSLTEVEAKQHYVHGLFRAVENRVPVLKASASGFTSFVLPSGRLAAGLPYYEEGFLIADVPLVKKGNTPYTLLGDWFVLAAFAALFVLFVIYLAKDRPL